MTLFAKTTAGVLLAVVLILTLGRQEKDVALVLTMVVCCLTVMAALTALEPVLSFLYRLEETAQLSSDIVRILLKALGVGLIGEIAAMVCQDAGVGSLGKCVQMLSSAVILYLSIPVLEAVPELLQRILGGL